MEYEYKLKARYTPSSVGDRIDCVLKYRKPGKCFYKSENLFTITSWHNTYEANVEQLLNYEDEDIQNMIRNTIEKVEGKKINDRKLEEDVLKVVNKFNMKGTIRI